MIVDRYGKEMQSSKKPIIDEIAVQTIRDRYGSYPSQGLTPYRLTTIFKEADQGDVSRQAELFEEMEEKDLHLCGILQTRKLAVTGLEWEVLPATENDAKAARIAAAAKEMIAYIDNWEDALLDMADAVGKGFSVLEIMWEIAEGMVWVTCLNRIHQRRFTFNSPTVLLESPRLITDAEPVWGEELIPNKFVVHRHRARSGATARGGLLRPCAWMFLFKNFDIKDWLVFNELFSVPMRMGKYQPGTSAAEKDVLRNAVFNLGVDAAAIIPDTTTIELLESKLRGDVSSFEKFADFCDRAMSKAVLGHTGSAEGTPGKLGSEDQAKEVRQDLLEADAKALMKTMTSQLLAPWTAFNFGPDAGVPQFKLRFEGSEDLERTARVYSAVVKDMGYEGISVKHIHERFGIPEPEKGEMTLADVRRRTAEPERERMGDGEQRGRGGDERQANKETPESSDPLRPLIAAQQEIDGLISDAVAGGGIDLSALERIVTEAESYEDLQDRIAEAYSGIDLAQFREILARAMFMADLTGRTLA